MNNTHTPNPETASRDERYDRLVVLETEARKLRNKFHTRDIGIMLAEIGLESDRLAISIAGELGLPIESIHTAVSIWADVREER